MRPLRGDTGATLLELLGTMAVLGILSGIAATSFVSYQVSSEHRAARDEVVSSLRKAAQQALSEGRTYCLHFDGSTWETWRFACDPVDGVKQPGSESLGSAAESVTPAFSYAAGMESRCPTTGMCAYFYPRGNASAGTVTVARSGRDPFTVRVEGLTSRVYAD